MQALHAIPVKEEAQGLVEELRKNRVGQDPWVAARYIGTRLESFGIRKPVIHSIASKCAAAHKDSNIEEIHQVVDVLWHAGIYDARSLAISILRKFRRKLDRSSFHLISKWYDDVDNWSNCDGLSLFILGELMFRDESITSDVCTWVESSNFWKRRGAVTSTIPANREGRSDPGLVIDMVRSLLDDDEYFVRKSLGWVLRELGKSEPKAVATFLEENEEKLDKDQLRKAVKYIPKNLARGVLE